jgi:hypothetical protein
MSDQGEGKGFFQKIVSGNPLYDRDLKLPPWKIGVENYARITDAGLIETTLQQMMSECVMLVLVSVEGDRYGNTILLNFDRKILEIEWPLDYNVKTVDRFRIYFQDNLGVWSFFEVKNSDECPHSLCVAFPQVLYRLQRRQYHRVEVPLGTRTVFWENANLRDGGYVHDISVAGMLISTGTPEPRFEENALLNEIAIALPPKLAVIGKSDEQRLVLPVIPQGRIVRTFLRDEFHSVYHGVSFEHDRESEQKVESFVESVKAQEKKEE